VETLTAANARLVDVQAQLPLAQAWSGGEVASADFYLKLALGSGKRTPYPTPIKQAKTHLLLGQEVGSENFCPSGL
jgi:hypothetical protein